MKVVLAVVGRAGKAFADAIAEYEKRAARYWPLEIVEVKAVKAGSKPDDEVRAGEAAALLDRLPRDLDIVALTRVGERWSSEQLSQRLQEHALRASPGVAFVIGGALGLGDEVLARARQQLSLSSMTLPHDVARLIMTEQLYRAGAIARGEPYHKGR